MVKWEYKAEDVDTGKLNALGQEGWEAVGIMSDPQFNEYARELGPQWFHHSVLLKRPIHG